MVLASNTLLVQINVLPVLDMIPIAEIMTHHKQQQLSPSHESGFTIIESLVALLVAALLLSAIAPVIVLSVATRVQAKRIETATNAAKSYIDGVRSGTIQPPELPITGTTDIFAVANYAPPAVGTLTCNTTDTKYPYCTVPATNLYCVDIDGGGCTISSSNDFVIQAFRYNKGTTTAAGGGTTNITDPTQGYQLGIRVYRADGFGSDGGDLKNAPNKQMTFSAGLGDRKSPLIEITTDITNTSTNFNNFCQRLKDPTNTTSNSTCN